MQQNLDPETYRWFRICFVMNESLSCTSFHLKPISNMLCNFAKISLFRFCCKYALFFVFRSSSSVYSVFFFIASLSPINWSKDSILSLKPTSKRCQCIPIAHDICWGNLCEWTDNVIKSLTHVNSLFEYI